jgi:hypothetical protein
MDFYFLLIEVDRSNRMASSSRNSGCNFSKDIRRAGAGEAQSAIGLGLGRFTHDKIQSGFLRGTSTTWYGVLRIK